MADDLLRLLANSMPMTDRERRAQLESVIYGNTKIGNDAVTREMVHAVVAALEELEGDNG